MLWWIGAALAQSMVDGRYDAGCDCVVTRDVSGWTGAVPLSELTALLHELGADGRATGLSARTRDGTELRLATGDDDIVGPLAARLAARFSLPVVHPDGTPCTHLPVAAPEPPPGSARQELIAFSGSGQEVLAVSALIAEKAGGLDICLPPDRRAYAAAFELAFTVVRSGDFDHAVITSSAFDDEVGHCMARRVEGWRTSLKQTGEGDYRWSVQLDGIPTG